MVVEEKLGLTKSLYTSQSMEPGKKDIRTIHGTK